MFKSFIRKVHSNIVWPFLPNGIYCFNYHRIGDMNKSPFDPNVFSCTEELFEKHIQFYNDTFCVISVDDLINIINKNEFIHKKYALITFDDGYIDNYSIAFPILKKYCTPAAFFIATNHLDSPGIPWWDEIAWIIRHSKVALIKFCDWNEAIDISTGTITLNIRTILKKIKQDKMRSMEDKIKELENICQSKMTDNARDTKLFMDWEQVKEMSESRMHIGSHTLSHNILSHLSKKQQNEEIVLSKKRIEEKLGIKVTSFAYPVGGKAAFTEDSKLLVEQANYELAFSFIPGIISNLNKKERYQYKRLPVDNNCSISQLRQIIVKHK
ncbi:polysaccharide deacetylase family protein [Colwellia sp. MB3u-4]|uniref:polysaccharide deacetylase family protein n=1 Tax=Colwellia sp. MB3u-4 TaxID=2759822 RepID=UPI0015F3E8BA|nr:polysaccharide deacetylase family protein [Colwellia sp. MB3u-4]MBA6290443.1 polysaccharide deacetylase family protein [Colwellia sp. MB3u-4]